MNLEMEMFVVGSLGVNCYILYNEKDHLGVAIDPGGDGEILLRYLEDKKIELIAILNTHAHVDHIGAVDFLRDKTGARFYVHEADAPMLSDSKLNLSAFMGMPIVTRPADVLLHDGEVLNFGDIKLTVLHTPGHSPGSVCYLLEDRLFSGDTLFAGSVGRTDFPGASMEELLHSLHEKIMGLPEALPVYCGHGPSTSVGYEKQCNPYLNFC
ncbi:MBL fold metallo-hydrolase [Selenomonas sputigena]|uniref:MBL fold metallo-hydrolase n=1 Tax=Selenomonas sputigena TaxID=69823 RepID=A0ABV3X2E9_9FIRM